MGTKTGGAKGKKIGRNKTYMAVYRAEQRREVNKVRRVLRHLKRHPNNLTAVKCLEKLRGFLYERNRKLVGL